jgi:uncharacterized membrane protein
MLSLFIPTTPNPTTGWYAMVPEEEVINLQISVEDAFKVLISAGIVSPTASIPASLKSQSKNGNPAAPPTVPAVNSTFSGDSDHQNGRVNN